MKVSEIIDRSVSNEIVLRESARKSKLNRYCICENPLAMMSQIRVAKQKIIEASNQLSLVFPFVEISRISSARRAYRVQTLTSTHTYLLLTQCPGNKRRKEERTAHCGLGSDIIPREFSMKARATQNISETQMKNTRKFFGCDSFKLNHYQREP